MIARPKLLATDHPLLPAISIALVVTPVLVILCTLLFLNNSGIASFLKVGAIVEMTGLGFLTLSIGISFYFGISVITRKNPMLMEVVAIVLSQVGSSFLLVVALIHNPQGEFCKPGTNSSAIAVIYQLDSCGLTIDFWVQGGVVGFVLAAFSVLASRVCRAFFS